MRYARFTDLRGRTVEPATTKLIPQAESAFLVEFREALESLAEQGKDACGDGDRGNPAVPRRSARPRCAGFRDTGPSGGHVLGVLSALVDFELVWDAVIADHAKTPRTLFVVEPVVACSPRQRRRCRGSTSVATLSDSQIVSRFRDHSNRANETMPFEWAPRRAAPVERYLGSYWVSSEGWGIFVQAKEHDVYDTISQMIESAVQWGALALLGALAAAAFFARILADPIKRLADTTQTFAQGDFTARSDVRSITEVGDLAVRFNFMAGELEDRIRALKESLAENRELFRGTAEALASAIDAKDPYTRGHSNRVNNYAKILAGTSAARINKSATSTSPRSCTTSARSASTTRS
jgi:HAMP domain-containing protein